MLSDDADYMTGSTLTIDGGVSLPWWSNRAGGDVRAEGSSRDRRGEG